MRTVLGGIQFLRQISSLLGEILSARVAGVQIVLQLRLGRFHLIDFGRLHGQFVAEIRDRFVALLDLGARDFALVTRVAQLLFQRNWGLYAWLGRDVLGNLGRMTHANAISVEAKRQEKQNSRGIEHPYLSPRHCTGESGKAMGGRWKIAHAAESAGLVLFLLRQTFEESLFSLFR
jgi:hypothetical protein